MENTTTTDRAVRVALRADEIVDYICACSALREFTRGDDRYRRRILSYVNRPELESVIRQAFTACVAYLGDAVASSEASSLSLVLVPASDVTAGTVADQLCLAVARAAAAVIATATGEDSAGPMRRSAAGVLDRLRGKGYSPGLTVPWR